MPRTLTANTSSHSSRSSSSTRRQGGTIPAAATSTSSSPPSLPRRLRARPRDRVLVSGRRRSAPSSPWDADRARRYQGRRRARRRLRSGSAIAAPIPLAAPVTSARRPASEIEASLTRSLSRQTAPHLVDLVVVLPAQVDDHLVDAGFGERRQRVGDQLECARPIRDPQDRAKALGPSARIPRGRGDERSLASRASPGRTRRPSAAAASHRRPRRRGPSARGEWPPSRIGISWAGVGRQRISGGSV